MKPLDCHMPYTHLIFDFVSGKTKYCCKMHGGINMDDQVDYKNNLLAKSLRKSLREGQKPKLCKVCWEAEEKGVESWRQVVGNFKPWHDKEKLINTDNPHFTRIEVMFDNTCDLACIYCGPWLSSSWMQEVKREQGKYWIARDTFPNNKLLAQKAENRTNHFIHTIENIAKDSKKGAKYEIAFLGGEPFLSPQIKNGKFARFIEAFYKHADKETLLLLNFITNLNTPDAIWNKNAEILNECRQKYPNLQVHISMSLESVGRWTEISRYNSEWKQVDKNIKRWLGLEWINYNFNTAFNCITIQNISEYLRYLQYIHKVTGRKIDVAPNVVYEPKGLGTSTLDKSFLPEIQKGLNKLTQLPTSMFEEEKGNGKQSLVNVLQNIIDTLGNNATEKMLGNLKEYTDYMINNRGIDLQEFNPKFYNYIYNR